jgi:aspartyl-tRNA(Asn)/glutamyl-tRNA(Gln) amidotransferase subunit C
MFLLNAEGPPMQVDQATVRRIARLARIKIDDEEAKALEKELSGILDWVRQLDEVDTSKVEPITRVIPMTLKKRADEVSDGGIAGDIVKNAPAREDHFFAVPKVVE